MTGEQRIALEGALASAESALASEPGNKDRVFDRACILQALRRFGEAIAAYHEVLEASSAHFGALTNLGALRLANGASGEALPLFERALASDPRSVIAQDNLRAAQGLASGDASTVLRAKPEPEPVQLLVINTLGPGNVRPTPYVDHPIFATTRLTTVAYNGQHPLPAHHIVFNTVGDADLCAPALETVLAMIARTNAPVVNHPRTVLATTRVANAARLGALPGVTAPLTRSFPRSEVLADDARSRLETQGFAWPLLVRAPGFHTGQHFELAADPEALRAVVRELPGEDVLVIEFFDARSADELTRKYRVMIVDGRLYPLHLAIANQWKVHYFSADNLETEEHRAEERAFLDNMHTVIGAEHVRALEGVRDALALDYAGVDFSIDSAGRLLVWEANATMIVNRVEGDERFAYRRPAVDAIINAVRRMLIERAALGGHEMNRGFVSGGLPVR